MRQSELWNGRYRARKNNPLEEGTPWISSYMAYFEEHRGAPVIDLGCGDGRNALLLADRGYSVTACDFSAEALVLCGQHPGIRTMCFDMTEGLPFADGSAGVVLASLSTHYFSLADTARLYKSILRVLRPGGYLLVKVNSLAEYELHDRTEAVEELAPDYHRMRDGATKRYFSVASLTEQLQSYELIAIGCGDFYYHGSWKHAIEAVARRSD